MFDAFFLKKYKTLNQEFTLFQILNFSFLKIHSCVNSLTIDKFKLKNYFKYKIKKESHHKYGARMMMLVFIKYL